MSLEAFGDDGLDGSVTSEDLLDHGWESSEDGTEWWKSGEPEEKFSFEDAARIYDEARWDNLED